MKLWFFRSYLLEPSTRGASPQQLTQDDEIPGPLFRMLVVEVKTHFKRGGRLVAGASLARVTGVEPKRLMCGAMGGATAVERLKWVLKLGIQPLSFLFGLGMFLG